MNDNEHHHASPHGVRPHRKAPAAHQPIGWRAANRILKGQDGGPGTEDLRTLIAVASATASTSAPTSASSFAAFASDDRAHAEAAAESVGREAMLTEFRESAAAWETGVGRRRTGSRNGSRKTARKTTSRSGSRHTSRALVLRFATAVLLVCGVGAAAASAGVLPSGMQRIARDYFGIGGVTAPSTHVRSSNAVTTGPPNGGGGNGGSATMRSGTASVAPTASDIVVALCQRIARNEGNWQTDVGLADQATLITAAGGEHKVKSYCAQLLAGSGKGAIPSPNVTDSSGSDATGTPSPAPSADATATHGKSHASHPPATHGAGG